MGRLVVVELSIILVLVKNSHGRRTTDLGVDQGWVYYAEAKRRVVSKKRVRPKSQSDNETSAATEDAMWTDQLGRSARSVAGIVATCGGIRPR